MFEGIAIYKRAAIHPTCRTLLNVPIMQQNSNRKFMADRECSDFGDVINFVEPGFNVC
jgi:hypothetical protein